MFEFCDILMGTAKWKQPRRTV